MTNKRQTFKQEEETDELFIRLPRPSELNTGGVSPLHQRERIGNYQEHLNEKGGQLYVSTVNKNYATLVN